MEELQKEIDQLFINKAFLTPADVMELLSCNESVIQSWSKRNDSEKRPPRIIVGKSVRFPKKDFIRWLVSEQMAKG